jgi:argininosuccinate lyase
MTDTTNLSLCLEAMSGMVGSADFNLDTMRNAAESGYATATEIADWLVKNIDMPFRDAHHVTGSIVKLAEEKGCKLDELSLSDMQSIEPPITEDIYNVLNIDKAVESRIKD